MFAKQLSQDTSMQSVQLSVNIKKVDPKERLVYGEVYAPNVIDTHGHMMLPEDVKKMAHGFMISQKNGAVDVMHNNIKINASVVESFIAREGDPDYADGAWVAVTKVMDDTAWQLVLDGKLNGYSMEVNTRLTNALVEIVTDVIVSGVSEVADDHNHVYIVQVDESGRVLGGKTSEDNGHSHEIKLGTATEASSGHSHRFILP